MLWEYGRNLVKGIFDYEYYDITILDGSGSKYSFTGTIYQGGTRINFNNADRDTVLTLLRNNDTLKIYLESTKYSTSEYLFTVNVKGFASAYSSIR